jgi:hypothetical protein
VANALPPTPLKTPLLDDKGLIVPAWATYLRELNNRVGGTTGYSTTQLYTLISNLQAVDTALTNQANGLSQGRQL